MDCICLSRVAVVALLQAIVGFLLSVHCRASQFITSASFSVGKILFALHFLSKYRTWIYSIVSDVFRSFEHIG